MRSCRYILTLLFVTASFLLSGDTARASHLAGGELTYEHISGTTYRFTFKLYRDCSGSPADPTLDLFAQNGCNISDRFATTLYPLAQLPNGQPNGVPVNPGCPGYPTTCNGGTLQGYEEWWYTRDVQLSNPCSDWKFSVLKDARNQGITNIVSTGRYWTLAVHATLNNIVAPENHSPQFSVLPIAYVCAGMPYHFNHGVFDADGDSLSFELMQPQTCIGGGCPWSTVDDPFTDPIYNLADNPISTSNTFRLNRQTGQMSFTPDMQQISTMAMLINEYRNGVPIGSVMRDMQVVVIRCDAPPISFAADTLNITGGEIIDSVLHSCAGNDLNFCFNAEAFSSSAILAISDNAALSMQGATITYSGVNTDTVTGCVRWVPSMSDTGLHILTITVKDSACSPPGQIVPYVFSIPVRIDAVTTISGDSLICYSDSTRLQAIGGNNFLWSVLNGDTGSLSCSNCAAPFATPRVTTTYKVQSNLSSFYCKTADTFTVVVEQGPSVDLGADVVKCKGDTIQLRVDLSMPDSTNYFFSWHPPAYLDKADIQAPRSWAHSDMTYTVIVTPKSGAHCSSFDTIAVTVAADPSFDVDTAICINTPLFITNTSTGSYSSGWRWDYGDGDTSLLKDPTPHFYNSPGLYQVSLTTYPCAATFSRTIRVDTMPFVSFVTDNNGVCEGQGISFYPSYKSGAVSLLWDFGDGSIPVPQQIPQHAFDSSGLFAVTLRASYPVCPDVLYTDTIVIYPYPKVDLGADTSICLNADPFLLTNRKVNDSGLYSFSWGPEAGGPSMIVTKPGTYSLTVRTERGCTATDSIEVLKACYLDIPNAFSPNGDGVNDYFFPRPAPGSRLQLFSMQIYNRWGVLLFETNQPHGRGWDGKYNAVEQPPGVYLYIIEAKNKGQIQERFQGNLTLLR